MARQHEVPECFKTETISLASIGKLVVRMGGPVKNHRGVIIALHGASSTSPAEWFKPGEQFVKEKFRVVLPDLHTNGLTSPGKLGSGDIAAVLGDLALHFQASKFVLMGKSWGGKMAIEYALAEPTKITSLVLVAPAQTDESKYNMFGDYSVLVLWAKDDHIIPYSTAEKIAALDNKRITIHSVEEGGHRVLPEYAEPIIKFLGRKL